MQLSQIKLSLQNTEGLLLGHGIAGLRRRMLNPNLEEFLLEEARALPRKNVIVLAINLGVTGNAKAAEIEAAIKGHFEYLRKN